MTIKIKYISGLDKAISSGSFEDYNEIDHLTGFPGERISFQLLIDKRADEITGDDYPLLIIPKISGDLSEYATVRAVRNVPSTVNLRGRADADYISLKPALLPDLLSPLSHGKMCGVTPNALTSLWIELDIPEDISKRGISILTVKLSEHTNRPSDQQTELEKSISIEIIDAKIPEQKIKFTQWFHADCLSDYYGVEKWSDRHFCIIENFAKCAVKNGINMIYTPLLTPPLDNESDNRDIQLADITVTEGKYSFSWGKLDKWIDVMDRVGVKYFEIGHLFTQGGAKNATKAMGTVDGRYERLFPADTPSNDPEYVKFLRTLLTSFISHMKARGDDSRCTFHISDEPPIEALETYLAAKAGIADLIESYDVMDALSDYDFYEKGIVKTPVVRMNHLDPFIEKKAEGIWAYNCCAPAVGYSNRFIAMTLTRNRSIALMLYKYDFKGFLHWGFNFYNTSGSWQHINPFLDTSSGNLFPSGDPFSVYPGDNGEPWESMRIVSFGSGLFDMRIFMLCESLYSRDEVIAALESELGGEITPATYVNDSASYLRIRERIVNMIKAKLSK